MIHNRKQDRCARCRKQRTLHGRDLCASCYRSTTSDGTRDDWPRNNRTSADVIAGVERLRGLGLSWTAVAIRLGYASPKAASNGYHQAKRHLERAS